MIWPSRKTAYDDLLQNLSAFSKDDTELKGILRNESRESLALQMVASIRRLEFTKILLNRDVSSQRADPNSSLFDPERAAIYHARNNNSDEAIWLIFLSIHFGKNAKHGWRMLQDVYSGLHSEPWTWQRISSRPQAFEAWMKENYTKIGGAFGNHRKYETLNPTSTAGTSSVILSFIAAVSPSPTEYFRTLVKSTGNDPYKIFDAAYRTIPINRFGRLAKFDFLCLLGRLNLAPIEPGSTYLSGATGPQRGARLLIDGKIDSRTKLHDLEHILQRLGERLQVGMQVMEDSICNWQKSPTKFIHFKG